MFNCYCGSNIAYADCCKPFIEMLSKPETPEQLMRSRYSAYAQGLTDYIARTMSGKALQGFDRIGAKNWAQSVIWLGLTVIKAYNQNSTQGFVEFSAKFMSKNHILQEIHELSEFELRNDRWFYIDGQHLNPLSKLANRKIPLNQPCPCGSGRKFKSCHFVT